MTAGNKAGIYRWLWRLTLVAVLSALPFAFRLDEEPFFADESAHVAQTYYYRLAKQGDFHHVDWVHPAAFDHTPIYKYLIGAYFDLIGADAAIPISTESWERWISGRFEPPRSAKTLRDARLIMLTGAVLGCVLLFVLGCQLVGPRTGYLAAVLLAVSPLYYTHARRAMADDWTQAFVIGALVGYIWLLRELEKTAPSHKGKIALAIVLTGICAGLAPATKLNGITAFLAIGAFTPLALRVRRGPEMMSGLSWKRVAAGVCVLFLAFGTFIGMNPYFYANPGVVVDSEGMIAGRRRSKELEEQMQQIADMGIVGRAENLLRHRTEGLEESMPKFQEYALPTIADRARAIAREGFGRWSAFGRLPPPPELRTAFAFVVVGLGAIYLTIAGTKQRQRGQVPIAWLILLWPAVEIAMLLWTLTLDWDRYYMGVVTWVAILSAVGIGGTMQAIIDRLVLRPPTQGEV